MQLLINGLAVNTLDVAPKETVGSLRGRVSKLEGGSVSDILLFINGRPLQDDCLLLSDVATDLDNVQVTLRLPGGKVHGSLARAGKVKGQTPKVEKVEKKKLKTGRAKRRMQYNRRFVNVVAGFGRKKGPNSQEAK